MVAKTEIKANYRQDRGGWVIYLPKKLAEDSSFPFNAKDKLVAKIENKKLIIEKA